MQSLMKPFIVSLFVFAPIAVHAQMTMTMGGDINSMSVSTATDDAAKSKDASSGIAVKYVGTASDTTVIVTTDSAMKLLKTTRTQIIFVDNVRSSRKALAKLDPSRIASLEFQVGGDVIKQYGDVAKNGVLTVTTKSSPVADPARKR